MKKIAIIQTGQPVASALEHYGDFDQWFIQAMEINPDLVEVYRVYDELKFPETNDLAGIIISGSPAMVTENHHWSQETINWLKPHLELKTPILGVCYGHQLLAQLLGGVVDWNPNGREMGQVQMQLTATAKEDMFFADYFNQQQSLDLYASHLQSVIQLPQTVKILGTTKLDPHHCFSYNNHLWGFQFHPEFDQKITLSFLQARKQAILKEGLDYQTLCQSVKETSTGKELLKAFKGYCYSGG